jgi:hypothetical protein
MISLRSDIWAHKTSLAPPNYINVPAPSQESERSCICVLGISIYLFLQILHLIFTDIVLHFTTI